MDPLLFDVLWHTEEITGFHDTVDVLSGYRSPAYSEREIADLVSRLRAVDPADR